MGKTIGIIGGDRRQAELANILRKEGRDVSTCGLGRWLWDNVTLAQAVEKDILVLPLPLCRTVDVLNWEGECFDIRELFRMLRPEQILLAGKVEARQHQQATELGLTLRDYLRREEFAVLNAAATAEAAVRVALEHSERSLCGMQGLILGFGRIGKLLAPRLQALGCRVTVAARKAVDRAWVQGYGFQSLDITQLSGKLGEFDVVFNTVPAMILDEVLCEELPAHCLAVELASGSGIVVTGKVDVVAAQGLPGKYVPLTAAYAVREAIRDIIL